MKVKLLGHEAEVDHIHPRPAFGAIHPRDTITVWFNFEEAVGSTLGFGIEIEAKDYEPDEFLAVILDLGEQEVERIIESYKARHAEMEEHETKRKTLNKLTADLGDKLGVPFTLNTR